MLGVSPLTAICMATGVTGFLIADFADFWPARGLTAVAFAAGSFLAWRDMRLAGGGDIRAFRASQGWEANGFELEGLEADGEALQEFADKARLHGYRREPGPVLLSWRFVRDVSGEDSPDRVGPSGGRHG